MAGDGVEGPAVTAGGRGGRPGEASGSEGPAVAAGGSGGGLALADLLVGRGGVVEYLL